MAAFTKNFFNFDPLVARNAQPVFFSFQDIDKLDFSFIFKPQVIKTELHTLLDFSMDGLLAPVVDLEADGNALKRDFRLKID